MGPRLLRGVWTGAIVAMVLGVGAVTAQAAPVSVGTGFVLTGPNAPADDCPTVDPTTFAVTPAPMAGDDWSGCDLENANLAGVDVSNVTLSGADLSSADLEGADLESDSLSSADLSNSDLDSADLGSADLTDADLAQADLNGASFTGATLAGVSSGSITASSLPALPDNWSLIDGYLIGPGADLGSADLSNQELADQDLAAADLNAAGLSGADLSGANLSSATLTDATLTDATLTGATLTSAVLTGATLTGATITSASLTGATLGGVVSGQLTGTPAALPANWSLSGGYLIGPGAELSNATLTSLKLAGDDLAGADLTSAELASADLTGASLTNADLNGANLSSANLTQADLAGATVVNGTFSQVTWSDTTCPDSSNSNSHLDGCFSSLDTQAPVAAPTVAGTLGSNGWYRSGVTVTWHWTDNGTIVSASCTKTSSTAANGQTTLKASCTDLAGNVGHGSENVKIDTTTPQVTLAGVKNGAEYPLGEVPATACKTADPVSGVAKAAVLKVTTTGSGGLGSFTASCSGAVSIAGASQPKTISVSYSVAYGFAGFTTPNQGVTVPKSSHRITVRFRLIGSSGQPIPVSLGKSLASHHRVRVSLTGPGIKPVTALCAWSSGLDADFACVLKIPAGVKTGSKVNYSITASELLTSEFKTAPPATNADANPEQIHFK
jgi:uncharacterized protein YjbI with pentapeptide repeats